MERHQFTSAGTPSDQAIEWLARLRADDVTEAEKADFAQWLAASSLHRTAFDEATELWHELAVLPTLQVSAKPKKRSIYTRSLPLAAAASVVFACMFMILQLTTTQFNTGKGEQRRVLLSDGSTAFLNTNSSMSVSFYSGERRITLHRGEVWFDVVKDSQRPFVVEGQFASATAVGTAFTVRETPGFTRVAVTEGTVSVAPLVEDDAAPQLLTPGQLGTVSATLTDVKPFDPLNALSWQHGQLIYDNVRLDDLLADLSRYLPKTMTLNDVGLESTRVSAVLRLEDQDAMLEALDKTLPIRWKAVSDSLIIITADR